MAFYRITVGNGTAYVDSYVIETEYPTTDYGGLTDILVDYLVEQGDSRILDGNEYEWNDDYETIHPINDPDWAIYPDEFVQGGNGDYALMHYGDFRIDEITEDQITENDIIVPDVW